MINVKNKYDTLYLIIEADVGIVSEYQRKIYEAFLLGVYRVIFAFSCDSYFVNQKNNRAKDIIEKLQMTCDVLNMEILESAVIWSISAVDSKILKTNDDGKILTPLLKGQVFDDYKNKSKNRKILVQREGVGKVFVKEMTQKWKNVKVTNTEIK